MTGPGPVVRSRAILFSSAIFGAALLAAPAHAQTSSPPSPAPAIEPASATPKPSGTIDRQIIGGGAITEQGSDASVRPFKFRASDEALAELRRRIAATQWPEKETVSDESQGIPLATMQELARYWASDYDWRKAEARLNSYPQFVTTIDGLDIHFIHVKSKESGALPLVIPLMRKYANEPLMTRTHLHVMAIERLLFQKLGKADLLPVLRADHQHAPAYARAYEIVDEVGADPILADLRQQASGHH